MKTSVKMLAVLLLSLILIAMGGIALASDYDHCADALKAMGLFAGSDTGYDLDKQATRAEAAAMLVRLLGAEEEAVESNYEHPFTDVPQWASPYIGYMFEKGLTKGTSATTFAPQGVCDLRMYSAFMLRALGYADDFEYAEADNFAVKLGVVDIVNAAGEFTCDNLVAISYTALFAPTKGEDTILLSQLIEQGAVTAEAAQPYLTLYEAYAQTQLASAKMNYADGTPAEIKFDMAMNMDMDDIGTFEMKLDSLLQVDAAALTQASDIQSALAALDKAKIGMTNKLEMAGLPDSEDMSIQLDLYLLDGMLYINSGDLMKMIMGSEEAPSQLKLDLKSMLPMLTADPTALEQMQVMFDSIQNLMPQDPYAPYYGIHMVKEIKVTELAGGAKRYDLTYAAFSNDLINSIITGFYAGMPELMEMADQMEVSYDIHVFGYTFDKDGNLKSMNVNMDVVERMFIGTPNEMGVTASIQMDCQLTKTGDDVKITLPGKAEDYKDIMELMAEMYEPQPEPVQPIDEPVKL